MTPPSNSLLARWRRLLCATGLHRWEEWFDAPNALWLRCIHCDRITEDYHP